MTYFNRHSRRIRSGEQRGFTLLEILIAMTIGLFMVGAILVIEQSNRSAFVNQNQLAQVQDGERIAMNILAEVIQSAGYFPNPVANVTTNIMPSVTTYATFMAGQSITGAVGDSIAVRYVTASGDGILNCSGTANTSGGNLTYVSVFSVIGGQLVCTMNGTQYTLVNNVANLSIYYGVNTTGSGNNVDTYLRANQMTAANWNNVISVLLQLTVNNPLYVAGQAQPQFFRVQRAISVMNKSGVAI